MKRKLKCPENNWPDHRTCFSVLDMLLYLIEKLILFGAIITLFLVVFGQIVNLML